MNDGKVFACQPIYGRSHPTSVRAMWWEPWKPGGPLDGKVIQATGGSSLLGQSFNGFWSWALNRRAGGEPIDYFAMLHDDVVPEGHWLDALWGCLQETEADLVSAVVPMKDDTGITTTAIDDPSDRYAPLRRLAMDEVARLPETFTAADCGYPDNKLLLNTGCWMCRLDRRWCTEMDGAGRLKAFFTIRDEVAWQDGKFVVRVEPEDWGFSRRIQDLGAKCVATTRVKLRHVGEKAWSNDSGWGQCSFDDGNAHKFAYRTII